MQPEDGVQITKIPNREHGYQEFKTQANSSTSKTVDVDKKEPAQAKPRSEYLPNSNPQQVDIAS